ncbi:unnamed protein product [Amoebophrya sp. A25]|nr:unnamed protein product [Amoebophrya sp. A25]|eukprot:GSA25T00021584001.1
MSSVPSKRASRHDVEHGPAPTQLWGSSEEEEIDIPSARGEHAHHHEKQAAGRGTSSSAPSDGKNSTGNTGRRRSYREHEKQVKREESAALRIQAIHRGRVARQEAEMRRAFLHDGQDDGASSVGGQSWHPVHDLTPMERQEVDEMAAQAEKDETSQKQSAADGGSKALCPNPAYLFFPERLEESDETGAPMNHNAGLFVDGRAWKQQRELSQHREKAACRRQFHHKSGSSELQHAHALLLGSCIEGGSSSSTGSYSMTPSWGSSPRFVRHTENLHAAPLLRQTGGNGWNVMLEGRHRTLPPEITGLNTPNVFGNTQSARNENPPNPPVGTSDEEHNGEVVDEHNRVFNRQTSLYEDSPEGVLGNIAPQRESRGSTSAIAGEVGLGTNALLGRRSGGGPQQLRFPKTGNTKLAGVYNNSVEDSSPRQHSDGGLVEFPPLLHLPNPNKRNSGVADVKASDRVASRDRHFESSTNAPRVDADDEADDIALNMRPGSYYRDLDETPDRRNASHDSRHIEKGLHQDSPLIAPGRDQSSAGLRIATQAVLADVGGKREKSDVMAQTIEDSIDEEAARQRRIAEWEVLRRVRFTTGFQTPIFLRGSAQSRAALGRVPPQMRQLTNACRSVTEPHFAPARDYQDRDGNRPLVIYRTRFMNFFWTVGRLVSNVSKPTVWRLMWRFFRRLAELPNEDLHHLSETSDDIFSRNVVIPGREEGTYLDYYAPPEYEQNLGAPPTTTTDGPTISEELSGPSNRRLQGMDGPATTSRSAHTTPVRDAGPASSTGSSLSLSVSPMGRHALPRAAHDGFGLLAGVRGGNPTNVIQGHRTSSPTITEARAAAEPYASQQGLIHQLSEMPWKYCLAVDIGAARTKFKFVDNNTEEVCHVPKVNSQDIWETREPAIGLREYLTQRIPGEQLAGIDRIIFSVPGTIDIQQAVHAEELTVVKNMPSFQSNFRGFDFKARFRPFFPGTKVSACCDNLAAAIGCAAKYPNVSQGLVVVLGTAPAVSTFNRKGNDGLETGIWQSWVWFTKIALKDRYGYAGGVKVLDNGKRIVTNPPDFVKMPHKQSRIRFALDNRTWLRFQGKEPTLPAAQQGTLTAQEATKVWVERLRAALRALAIKFHQYYGPPDAIFVLGGNSLQVHGLIEEVKYDNPENFDMHDTPENKKTYVPVFTCGTDAEQQDTTMIGLLQSSRFKVKQVYSAGSDPLDRGWTRGGEIYHWVLRSRAAGKDVKQPSPGGSVGSLLSLMGAGGSATRNYNGEGESATSGSTRNNSKTKEHVDGSSSSAVRRQHSH